MCFVCTCAYVDIATVFSTVVDANTNISNNILVLIRNMTVKSDAIKTGFAESGVCECIVRFLKSHLSDSTCVLIAVTAIRNMTANDHSLSINRLGKVVLCIHYHLYYVRINCT